jgi:hypothetical protein
MSEPSRPAPPSGTPSNPWVPSKQVEFLLYASAAISYVGLSIYNKWLLDWIVGPFWLVAWVWGLPALVRLVRGQPVKPRRGPSEETE